MSGACHRKHRDAVARMYCDTGQGCERSLLKQRLRRRKGILEVVLQANALPSSPWPELADPRVRVSFAVKARPTA